MKLFVYHINDLPQQATDYAALARSLPFGEAEAMRIAAMGNTEAARCSLGALVALSRLTETVTENLTICRTPEGKPYFLACPQLYFSLSHSKGLCIAALSENEGAVGMDAELLADRPHVDELAARFFSQEEQEAVNRANDKRFCFYRIWTKKEAVAKRSGQGLSALLSSPSPVEDGSLRFGTVCMDELCAMVTVCAEHPIRSLSITGASDRLSFTEYRIEHDSMGEMAVPAHRLWGAQTQRSLENFPIGDGRERMPTEILHAFGYVKLAAARANQALCPNRMTEEKRSAIEEACQAVINGSLDEEFPLVVWQTGSGTQTNMNVNEVIAGYANRKVGRTLLHPNDDVNMSQSSNDTFPSAMQVAARLALEDKLIPSVQALTATLLRLEEENQDAIKCGRTHLQDAVPLRFSHEISGWRASLEQDVIHLQSACDSLRHLALGGTAVGTGLNAPDGFDRLVTDEMCRLTGREFSYNPNKFHSLTSLDELVFAHGAVKGLAADLMKMANDVRWLASGPRNGLGEIFIPENEPGSSIMPGKVNPTQCESLTMIALQVMANDVAVGMAASQGNFELNVYLPVCIDNFLRSVRLLSDGMTSFRLRCAEGIRANRKQMRENLERSLMCVTALNPHIGYEKAAKVAKLAHEKDLSLREACVALGFLDGEEFDRLCNPEDLA